MDWKNLLVLTAFVINFFLSLLIHFRSKRNRANVTFEITAFGITFWCLAMVFYRASGVESVIYFTKLLYFFPTFIPTAFLLFGLFFPDKTIKKRTLYFIVLLNVIMSFLVLYDGVIISKVNLIPGSERKIVFGPLYYVFYQLYITGFFFASYFILFKKYLKADPYIRMQILYILLGMTAASLPAMITNLNLPTFGYFEFNWVGQIFTIFWIGGVSYAIIKHRLLDIRFVVARVIAYSLSVILLGLAYAFGLFFIAGIFIGKATSSQQFLISVILAVFIAMSWQPLKRILEKTTDKIFFKDYYDSEELLSTLSRIMATTLDFNTLAESTLTLILKQMRITSGVFVLYGVKDGKDYVEQKGSKNFPEIEKDLLDLFFNQEKKIIAREELMEGELKEALRSIDAAVVLKMETQNKRIGILVLSDKSSGDIYSAQDFKLFEILAPELSIAIHNSQEYEQIKKFNITLSVEIEKATKELKDANERLKELDKVKDEFVSLASHELRTPMTVIKSYVWLMLQNKAGSVSEKQKTYLERTYSSTERLINLVNDMLNISRIESGRLVVNMKNVDLVKLMNDVVIEMQTKAQELGINLVYNPPASVPVIRADDERIKQVMINLIGNSLKFTPKSGNITVEVSEEEKFVKVKVVDTGKGISKDDIPKLFQKFNMVGNNYLTKLNTQGTGLGLYLSKSLIELHGGKIWAESEGEGKGSSFTFTLPVLDRVTQEQGEIQGSLKEQSQPEQPILQN